MMRSGKPLFFCHVRYVSLLFFTSLVMGRVYILCIRRLYAASLLHWVVIGEVCGGFGMCVFSAYS